MVDDDIRGGEVRMKQPVMVTLKHEDNHTVIIPCGEKESLLDAMIKNGVFVRSDCGGNGTCSKCRIQVADGNPAAAIQDIKSFSEIELQQGWRLACQAYPKEDCTVSIGKSQDLEYSILSEDRTDNQKEEQKAERKEWAGSETVSRLTTYAIAIDIGTTTLAIHLIDRRNGAIIRTYTALNKQAVFGADVISRIKASNEGAVRSLRETVIKDLLLGLNELILAQDVNKDQISQIVIAANTTMVHLLMGYSCQSLGTYPFTPVNTDKIEASFSDVFESEELKAPVVLLPGISAFVGADIVSGLLACNFDRVNGCAMLIDLGTNGELAIGNKNKILVCSTAAGPAFEGGNISCGIGSVAGAIDSVSIREGMVQCHTIGGMAPVGLCGTGVIATVSELIRSGIIDETGLLEDRFFENGFTLCQRSDGSSVTLTQKDIRELQMAKSAIRSGIEILIKRYGISYDQIEHVYLAGGFGFKLSIERAVQIGLLPGELSEKVKAVGNSALAGTVRYLTDEAAEQRIQRICSVAENINLSNDPDFNEDYIRYLNFDAVNHGGHCSLPT